MSSFGGTPFGGSAFGGLSASLVSENLTSGLSLATLSGVTDIRVVIAEALDLSDEALCIDLPNLIETLNLTGSITLRTTLRNAVADSVAIGDAMQLAWTVLLQEQLALTGAAAANPLFLGALVDTLHATGVAASRLDAVAAVAEALALESLISNGWSIQATESLEFSTALTQTASLVGNLVDQAALSAGVTNALRLVAIGSESLGLADSLTTTLQLTAEARDGLLLYATIRLGDIEYAGWVLNAKTKAPSQYTNFPFESLATFQGRSFGAGEGGIFELAGDDDAGEDIVASIRTGLMDWGNSRKKRVPDVYIGYSGTGRIVLKVVTTTDTGEKVQDWYLQNADARTGTETRTGKFDLGRGLASRFWSFELANKAGGTLDLASIEFRRLILDRRI